MKRIFSFSLGALIAGSLLYGITVADFSLSDLTDLINFGSNSDFTGYDAINTISISEYDTHSVTISSPVLEDSLGDDIEDYFVIYCLGHSILDDPSIIADDSVCQLSSGFEIDGDEATKTLDLLAERGKYYAIVFPMDFYGDYGNASNELTFQYDSSKGMFVDGNSVSEVDDEDQGDSDEAFACITGAGISCTWNKNTVTVNWNNNTNACKNFSTLKVNVGEWNGGNTSRGDFSTWKTVDFVKENKISHTVSTLADVLVKFTAEDGSTDYLTYTCHYLPNSNVETKTDPSNPKPNVPTVPTVGPKENALAIIVGAILLYGIYAIVRRKSN